jgi:uncharacterized membrane protein YedE/YeeE
MTDPQRVIGFLNVFGDFDPTLAFVFGGAVTVTLTTFRFILRMRKPALAARFELPHSHAIDAKLIIGAALFGVGWGLAGYCPGPAIAGLAIGSPEALWFVAAMVVGSTLYGWVDARGRRSDAIPTT